ncbi:hypothetical protein [Streptomyces sp. NPDC056669]|uniref:hypothetical protein n=1 Tax=Streptomyces sp. NPDC056669 TaxID=3345903 RepID=UPI0036C0A607
MPYSAAILSAKRAVEQEQPRRAVDGGRGTGDGLELECVSLAAQRRTAEDLEAMAAPLARTRLLEHVSHLADVRAQALAHRRASEVPISSLLSQDQPTDG